MGYVEAIDGRGVLEGAFALLAALKEAGEAGLTALAGAAGLPKTTAHRLLGQLERLGAVQRSGARYLVGPRMFELGLGWQPVPGLRAAAARPMAEFAKASGATVVVCVPRDGGALSVTGLPGEVEPILPLTLGAVYPGSTAAAKVLTADQSVALGSGAWTREAAALRERGLAFDREEFVPNVSCVAAPIHRRGEVVAAVAALAGSPRRLPALTGGVTWMATMIGSQLPAVR